MGSGAARLVDVAAVSYGPLVGLAGVEVQTGDAHRFALHVLCIDEGGLPDGAEVGARSVVVLPRLAVALTDVLAVVDGDRDEVGVAARQGDAVTVPPGALD